MQKREYIENQVTVVIPVYNEERFLRQCLESVVDQVDYVVLGDNASTDGTEAICTEFVEKYSDKIVYFRNDENLGAVKNSVLCYEKVQTEFVFHIGGHDLIPPNYVTTLKMALKNQPDEKTVGVFSPVRMIDNKDSLIRIDDFKMFRKKCQNNNPLIRASHFVFSRNPCNIVFGLFRSDIFLRVLDTRSFPIAGCDHLLLFYLLLQGKMIYCDDTFFLRRDVHNDHSLVKKQKDKGEYMARIAGNSYVSVDGKDISQLYRPMFCHILRDCATFQHPLISEYKRWKIVVELEYTLRKQLQISKIEEDSEIDRHCFYYRLARFFKKCSLLRKFIFNIGHEKNKIRIKICGPSFSIPLK
jgi:Glycosyltransferases involved in cell wall biogenesis